MGWSRSFSQGKGNNSLFLTVVSLSYKPGFFMLLKKGNFASWPASSNPTLLTSPSLAAWAASAD
jgi:hypothetical protein